MFPMSNQSMTSTNTDNLEYFQNIKKAISCLYNETNQTKRLEYENFLKIQILENNAYVIQNCNFLLGLLK